jgi:uncharacterized surface anchored protein
MKKSKRFVSALLSVLMIFGALFSLPLTANAADINVRMMDTNWDRAATGTLWGGGHIGGSENFAIIYLATGELLYCIEPGVALNGGDGLNFGNFVSTMTTPSIPVAGIVPALIGRLFQYVDYGPTGSPTGTDAGKALYFTTQILVWEITQGERDEDFNYVTPPSGYGKALDSVRNSTLTATRKQAIYDNYNYLVSAVQRHDTIPSFASPSERRSPTYQMTGSGTSLNISLNDTNNVLGNFNFTSPNPALSFSKSGNTLNVSASAGFTGSADINVTSVSPQRVGVVCYGDGPGRIQDLVKPIDDPVRAYFRLEVSTGNLSILKTTQFNGGSVGGFQFEVRNEAGTLIGNYTSGTDGTIYIPNLQAGTYSVKEINLSSDFVTPVPNPKSVTVTPGATSSVSFDNIRKRGIISVRKSNANKPLGDYNLQGATFEIKNAGGVLVDTVITDSQGKAQSKDLKLGDYVVSEKSAPYGYVRNGNNFPVKLEYGGQEVSVVYGTAAVPENPETGIIRVHKQNSTPSMGDYSLKGAVFEVRANQDIKQADGTVIYNKGDLADTITTNAAGNAQSKELPLGSYAVREKTAPYGFVLNTSEYNPVLTYAGQEIAVTYTDVTIPEAPQVGTITVTKYDVATYNRAQGDASLRGAVFEVFADEDIKKLDGSTIYSKNQLVDTLNCGNETSKTSKELPLGSYFVKEKIPPKGYTLDPTPHSVTIEYQGQNVAVVRKNAEVRNKVIEGQISVVKHSDDPDPDVQPGDIQIEAPLEGIPFEVFLKSSGSFSGALDSERDLLITDSDGYAISKKLPYGVYTVKELPDPQGRDVKLVNPFDVFISTDGKVYRYIIDDPWFRSLVKIIKVDSETGKQIPAAGVSFKVKDLSTGEWVEQRYNYPVPTTISVYETAPDGTLVMPESLKSGDYELYEQAAPWGYILTDKPVPFTIHSTQVDPSIAEVIMANAPAKGVITVDKVGNMLTGTTVSETSFGKQYTPIFSLTGLQGAVFDVIAAEDIYTPDGTLRAAKGAVVDTITTDSTGQAETKQLYIGNYVVIETKAPVDFVLDKTPYPATLTYEGEKVPVVSTQIGVGDIRQKVEIELQKLMEKPVNAPDDFSPFLDVIFGLFADQDIRGVDGKIAITKGSLIALMPIDENGKGTVSSELPFAKYFVKELRTNIYYQLNNTPYPVTAVYAGQDVVKSTVKVNNGGVALPNETKLGQITIVKTGEMLVGAVEQPGKLESKYVPTYEVRGLPDVTFDVIAAANIYDVYGKLITPKGTVVDSITTGADGSATTKLLHLGEYELIEKTVPFGYISDGKPIPVTLGFDGQLVGNILSKTVSIFNERQKAQVTLEKVCETPTLGDKRLMLPEGFNPYAAVRFGLYSKEAVKDVDGKVVIPEGKLIEYVFVDDNGAGTIQTDLPFGSYYLVEQTTAPGYALDETVYDLNFDYDADKGAVVEIAINGGEAIDNRLQRGSLKVIKEFEGRTTPIASVPFTITGRTTVGTDVTINAATDENGAILLTDLLVGEYTVVELESKLTVGYVLSEEENATVAAGEIAEMTINNRLQRGDLKIIKSFEGKVTPIAGVKFTVSGVSVTSIPFEGTFETDANGAILIEGLPVGEYKVLEIASDLTIGYVLSEEQAAAVAADELTEMRIDNKLIRGNVKLTKLDKANGGTLSGAVFDLYDPDGNIAGTYTGDENGEIFVEGLAYGFGYKWVETAAPEGYSLDKTEITFDITENGATVELSATNVMIPKNSGNPKTGDASNPTLWVAMMGVSLAALLALGKKRTGKAAQ